MNPKISIQDDDEFKRLLAGLSQDIVDAHIHWDQHLALEAQMNKWPQVSAQAYTFWYYALIAHQRTALMCLARVYDNDRQGLHLRSWLLAIRDHLHFFGKDQVVRRRPVDPFAKWIKEDATKPDSQQLDRDIRSCSIYEDADVKALYVYRGKLLAHRNAELMKKGDPSGLPSLLFQQVEILLTRAKEMLNRYTYMFEATIYGTQPVGHYYVEGIFKIIQNKLDQDARVIEEQIASLPKLADADRIDRS